MTNKPEGMGRVEAVEIMKDLLWNHKSAEGDKRTAEALQILIDIASASKQVESGGDLRVGIIISDLVSQIIQLYPDVKVDVIGLQKAKDTARQALNALYRRTT